MLSRTISLVAAGAVAGLAGSSSGEIFVATFDKLAEGHTTTVLVDGLITFRDLDQRIPGSTPPYPLVIEDASATLNGQPWFYPPNALGFGGYSPGPGASFGRFGSMRIIPPELCIWATVNVYEFLTGPGNSIVLAGYRNGVEVVRSTVPIAGGGGVHYYELRVESVLTGFDEFVLMGEGPNDQGVFFGLLDSVMMSPGGTCYPNCDASTEPPVLNIADFGCFLQKFAAGDPYSNCDGSTTPPILNVADFGCFLQRFAAGCG